VGRLAAGTGLLGTLAAACKATSTPVPVGEAFPQFRHVVVLMFENRSFDNVLGWLYEAEPPRGQSFEGLAGRPLSNPIPADADQAGRGVVPVGRGSEMHAPSPDPGEGYPHANTQLFGTVIPDANRTLPDAELRAPYNLPSLVPASPPMSGFVRDYVDQLRRDLGREPAYDEYRVVMDCFPAEALPVFNTLARQFAVFDHWFCAVPSETFTNRSFLHAASSSGKVENLPNSHWLKDNTAETIFNRIDDARRCGLSWRVYWDPTDGFSLTAVIHFPRLRDSIGSNFAHMSQFYRDARAGHLPAYSFIEPRLFFKHNDAHPPVPELGKDPWPSSVLAAEILLNDVYNAVRTATSADGSNWQNTLLLVLFDEHGGCYDHVPPPTAVPPDPSVPAGEMGFRFDRAGVRVPAIAISAYTEAATVIQSPFEHTALIKTLSTQWGLGSLTARDAAAPHLGVVFNRATPRTPDAWPVITPRPVDWQAYNNVGARLNSLQGAISGFAAGLFDDLGEGERDITTVGDALRVAKRAGQRLRFL